MPGEHLHRHRVEGSFYVGTTLRTRFSAKERKRRAGIAKNQRDQERVQAIAAQWRRYKRAMRKADAERHTSAFVRRLRAMGYKDYRAYLKSKHWREVRQRQPQTDCVCCGSEGPLDLHHQTYARLGNERQHDLAWLCRSCHRRLHRQRRSLRV